MIYVTFFIVFYVAIIYLVKRRLGISLFDTWSKDSENAELIRGFLYQVLAILLSSALTVGALILIKALDLGNYLL